MQHLRAGGWVKAIMLPPSPKVVASSLDNGWIQRQRAGGELAYRITEKGLAAKKAPIRIL
jgi:hypothetical protein